MLSFHRLADISPTVWLSLLNDPEVRRHMPLGGEHWTEERAGEWAAGKDAQWAANGYGPWAIRIDGAFAGWGGFQKEGDDADFGLVLLPRFWGHGPEIFRALIARGWVEFGFDHISILLPPTRTRTKGLARLGFEPDGELDYNRHRFRKFRLSRH